MIIKVLQIHSSKCFLILLVTIVLNSCYQKDEKNTSDQTTDQFSKVAVEVLADSVILNPTKGLVFYRNEPFTGFLQSRYANGVSEERTQYFKGKKNGLKQKWFENGQLSYEANYDNGRRNGVVKTWWGNGRLRSEAHYDQSKLSGQLIQWYTSGAIFKKMNYEQGVEVGLQQAWRENGKIYNNYEAKNGRIFGLKRANMCFKLKEEDVQYSE